MRRDAHNPSITVQAFTNLGAGEIFIQKQKLSGPSRRHVTWKSPRLQILSAAFSWEMSRREKKKPSWHDDPTVCSSSLNRAKHHLKISLSYINIWEGAFRGLHHSAKCHDLPSQGWNSTVPSQITYLLEYRPHMSHRQWECGPHRYCTVKRKKSLNLKFSIFSFTTVTTWCCILPAPHVCIWKNNNKNIFL